jgi:hypothetical protein
MEPTLISALSNPQALLDKYKEDAIKAATQALLIQAGLFLIISYIVTDAVVRKHKRR